MRLGIQVAPDALDYILECESPSKMVAVIARRANMIECPPVLSREFITRLIETPVLVTPVSHEPEEVVSGTTDTEEQTEQQVETQYKIEIVKNPDESSVASTGTIEDFLALFRDRFHRIRTIYMKRLDTREAVPIPLLKQQQTAARRQKMMEREGERVFRIPSQKVIGMVKTKTVSRSRNIILEIEDEEGSLICVVPSGRNDIKGQNLLEKGNSILLDEVICLSGRVDQDGRMIVDDILFPEIPTARPLGRAKKPVYAAFISDLHCGSYEFLEEDFERFIRWMRGIDCDEEDKGLIKNIHYLFIAGDLVDGVGVYPEQKEDLAITSLYEQYTHLAKMLSHIPDHVKIICIPGNHDACRQALPRPPLSKEFAKALYEMGDRVIMLGDPSQIKVEGVNILLTHGDSLDDLVTSIPGVSYASPESGMKELLRKRHLVPLYGGKTEIAPLHRDWMVIDDPPDIVHFGHAHHYAVDNYRGVQIINAGTFQDQTEFMRKQGIEPKPGMVAILNLNTGAPILRFFSEKIHTIGSKNNRTH